MADGVGNILYITIGVFLGAVVAVIFIVTLPFALIGELAKKMSK